MTSIEDAEMLELCESELDDLKSPEDLSSSEASLKQTVEVSKAAQNILPDSSKDNEVTTLYNSMGIDPKDPKIVTHLRFDTIFVSGLDEMSTQDLYSFFEPLKPIALEWIDDTSCNVVWQDESSAAQALLQFSHPMEDNTPTPIQSVDTDTENKNVSEDKSVKDSNEIVMIVEDDDEDEGSEDGEISDSKLVEKKSFWRIINRPNKNQLRMRFATWDDKKVRGAEKFSEYYKKHGNPNFGGMKGLISNSRKRKFRQNVPLEDFSDESTSSNQQNIEDARHRISQIVSEKSDRKDVLPKSLKMKMYADEEEKTIQRQKSSKISNRLGSITVNFSMDKDQDVDREKEDYDELEISSPQEFGSKSVWDRLQVEVPNTRYSYGDEKKRGRVSDNKTYDYHNRRDLRKKLQRIRDHKKDHRSPLLVGASTK